MAASKRIRGKRARARQRERRGYDMRPQYREGDLPTRPHIAVATIENPYAEAGRVDRAGNLDVEARLEPVRRRDGTLSEGAPAWTPPERPTLTAIVNLRNDAIGRMHARRQVDEAQTMPPGPFSSSMTTRRSAAIRSPTCCGRKWMVGECGIRCRRHGSLLPSGCAASRRRSRSGMGTEAVDAAVLAYFPRERQQEQQLK
jgi:hypothetical protein